MAKKKEIKTEQIWNEKKMQGLNELVLFHSEKQSKSRKLKNDLLAIQYQLEDYIENESSSAYR